MRYNQNVEQETSTTKSIKGPIVLLKEAWATFISNPSTVIKLMLFLYVFSVVLVVLLFILGIILYIATQNIALAIGLATLAGVPVMVYLQSWFTLVLTKALLSQSEGKVLGVKQTMQAVKPLVIPFILTSLLYGIITFGGYILLIIPGVILTIFFSLYTYVLLQEGAKGMRALLLSREYIRGYAGIVFIYNLIFWGLAYVVSFVPTYLLEQADLQILSSIISLLFNFVVMPIGLLFSIGIYKELKRVKGEVTIPNYDQRKWKYAAIGVLGIVVPLLLVVLAVTTIIPMMQQIFGNELMDQQYNIEELQEFTYPEAV